MSTQNNKRKQFFQEKIAEAMSLDKGREIPDTREIIVLRDDGQEEITCRKRQIIYSGYSSRNHFYTPYFEEKEGNDIDFARRVLETMKEKKITFPKPLTFDDHIDRIVADKDVGLYNYDHEFSNGLIIKIKPYTIQKCENAAYEETIQISFYENKESFKEKLDSHDRFTIEIFRDDFERLFL